VKKRFWCVIFEAQVVQLQEEPMQGVELGAGGYDYDEEEEEDTLNISSVRQCEFSPFFIYQKIALLL
jgi:hypothetical protein